MEARELLSQNFLFKLLDAAEIESLTAVVEPRLYVPGDYVVKEGEIGTSLFLVKRGGVNVTKSLEGHFLGYIGSGGCFGEMALFMGSAVRTANCVAAMDTECYIVEKSVLDKFCSDHPVAGNKIYKEIIRVLAERLQATSADLAMLMRSQVKSQDQVSQLVEAKRAAK